MTEQEAFDAIINFELEAGEDFLDQGFNLNERIFMTWCLGKGYINSAQYNLWVDAFLKRKLEAIDANYYVYDSYGDVPWAVVSANGEYDEAEEKRAYRILAEFISQVDVYKKRLTEFVKE